MIERIGLYSRYRAGLKSGDVEAGQSSARHQCLLKLQGEKRMLCLKLGRGRTKSQWA